MKKLICFLLLLSLIGWTGYAVVYRLVTQQTRQVAQSKQPVLHWLRHEFQLSDEAFAQVRRLHLEFDGKCQGMCHRLISSQEKLQAQIEAKGALDEELRKAIAENEALHRECREATLEHIFDMSRLMSPEQGERYRRIVSERLILQGRTPHITLDGQFSERAQSTAE